MVRNTRVLTAAIAGLFLAGAGAAIADAPYRSTLPAGSPEAPLFHGEDLPGKLALSPAAKAAPSVKTVDGNPADWAGTATNYGGTLAYSRGELVYTDHVFESFGADGGKDYDRAGNLDPLIDTAPELYRIEALYQANLPGEVGAPNPEQIAADDHYGDLSRVDEADIAEVRVGATADTVQLLVRTTTMTAAKKPAVLVLIDSDGQALLPKRPVPFNAGLDTATADLAVLLAPDGQSRVTRIETGETTPISTVAFRPDGWDNAVEASLPRSLFGSTDDLRLLVATGAYDAAAGNLSAIANIAFRTDEPVRGMYFDKQQAFSLYERDIDRFFVKADAARLTTGGTDTVALGPGYYDRIFRSSDLVSNESGEDGILQHYGVYVPTAYKQGTANPATFWMHWRGGKAHSAAVLAPRIMRDFGENRGNLVFSPRGRGTSSWYEGKGHVDFLQVWDDAMATYSVNPDRVYLTGHSMGGWASYFLASVYPDRFAATMPVEGTVTQGAYVSPVDDQCDQCYLETNNGDAKALHTYKILDNLLNTPIAIYQGLIDELVPETGTLLQARKLQDMGYRYRLYQFFQYEHYTHPILDEWTAGAQYMDRFTRDPNPSHVTYVRDMPFERAAETGPDQREGRQFTGLDLRFDSAYWMSGLTPDDPVNGVARFDGRTFAKPSPDHIAAPDTDAPVAVGQTGPYAVVGQQWLTSPLATTPAPENAFELDLKGVASVTLDAARMGLDPADFMSAHITTDSPVTVRLLHPAYPGGREFKVERAGTTTLLILPPQ